MTTTTYIVGVYEVGSEWHGSEQDGEWCKTGKLVRASRIFRNNQSAYDFVNRMNRTLQYRIKRPRTDPIYHLEFNVRLFHAQVHENKLPEFYSHKKSDRFF